jgi:putative peptidoglycan lipid II flippase
MTALVPTLAAQAVDGDDDGFRARTAGGIRAMALLMVPATAAFLVLSRPLIRTLLQHGVMQEESSKLVAGVLDMLALGLLPFSAFLLLVRAFNARQDTRTPLYCNLISNAAYVVASLALFPAFDVRGLGLSHTVCYIVAAGVAWKLLGKQVGGLEGRHTARELGKVVAATVVSAAAMLGAVGLVSVAVEPEDLRALLQLIVGGAVGMASFVVAAHAVGVEDLSLFTRLIPGRFRRLLPGGRRGGVAKPPVS